MISRMLGPVDLEPLYRKMAWFFVASPSAIWSGPMAEEIPVIMTAPTPAWAMVRGSCLNVSRPCSFNQVPPFGLLEEYTWSYLGSWFVGCFFIHGSFHLFPIVMSSFLSTVFLQSDSCEAGCGKFPWLWHRGALIVQSWLYGQTFFCVRVLCSVTRLVQLFGVCVSWSTVSVSVCVQCVQCVTGAGAVTYYSLI